MKVDIDLKAGFLQNLKREVLAQLTAEERAVIEVSTGEMGNKPDAVKLGWIPVPGYIRTLCDEYVIWFRWIDCACGRAMPVPR